MSYLWKLRVVKAWMFAVCEEEPWKQNVPVPVHEPTVKYF